MLVTKCKPRDCRSCRKPFQPRNSLQVVCSLNCTLVDVKAKEARRVRAYTAQRQKAARADLKKRKTALKTKSDWMKEAQAAFNRYIRARDQGKPCISSGVMEQDRFTGGYFDAGHYRSRGSAGHLRFNVFNCHAQSKHDNRQLSGNVVEYRKGLIERIGLERVDRLENDNTIRKFDIEYLTRVKKIFSKRAKFYDHRGA